MKSVLILQQPNILTNLFSVSYYLHTYAINSTNSDLERIFWLLISNEISK